MYFQYDEDVIAGGTITGKLVCTNLAQKNYIKILKPQLYVIHVFSKKKLHGLMDP